MIEPADPAPAALAKRREDPLALGTLEVLLVLAAAIYLVGPWRNVVSDISTFVLGSMLLWWSKRGVWPEPPAERASREGRVLLVGSVPRPEDKDAAAQIAWATEGVNAVEDEIVIGKDSGAKVYLEDVRIANELRLKLLRAGDVSSQNYDVATFGRVVHLTGLARSTTELDLVIRHAQEVKGVTRVVSHVLTIDDPRRVRAVATTS